MELDAESVLLDGTDAVEPLEHEMFTIEINAQIAAGYNSFISKVIGREKVGNRRGSGQCDFAIAICDSTVIDSKKASFS